MKKNENRMQIMSAFLDDDFGIMNDRIIINCEIPNMLGKVSSSFSFDEVKEILSKEILKKYKSIKKKNLKLRKI
jgi:hypothetical protein